MQGEGEDDGETGRSPSVQNVLMVSGPFTFFVVAFALPLGRFLDLRALVASSAPLMGSSVEIAVVGRFRCACDEGWPMGFGLGMV